MSFFSHHRCSSYRRTDPKYCTSVLLSSSVISPEALNLPAWKRVGAPLRKKYRWRSAPLEKVDVAVAFQSNI